MAKYLCIAALWVEADSYDAAADRVNDALGGGLRAADTVGKVVAYTEAQTHQDGFLMDAEKFDLGEVVAVGIDPPEGENNDD